MSGPLPPITFPPTTPCAAVTSRVREHYGTASLGQRVQDALVRAGLGEGPIDWSALAPIDEFHTGGLAATPYAVGLLRGHRDRYTRLGFLVPFTIAAIVTPFQIAVGDTAARAIASQQPVKFASMEYVARSTLPSFPMISGHNTCASLRKMHPSRNVRTGVLCRLPA